MTDEKEKVLDRIIKLFALADSSRNPSDDEVLAALSAAKKLMVQYAISEDEIKDREGKKKEENWTFGRKKAGTTSEKNIKRWQEIICASCAHITETQHIHMSKGIYFFGNEVDTAIAQALSNILIKIGVKNANRFAFSENKISYLHGYATGIWHQVSKKEFENKEEENKYAIVSTEKKNWLTKKVEETFSNGLVTVQPKAVTIYNPDLYNRGYQDGIKVNLSTERNLT